MSKNDFKLKRVSEIPKIKRPNKISEPRNYWKIWCGIACILLAISYFMLANLTLSPKRCSIILGTSGAMGLAEYTFDCGSAQKQLDFGNYCAITKGCRIAFDPTSYPNTKCLCADVEVKCEKTGYTIGHHINSYFIKNDSKNDCPEGFSSMTKWWLNCQTDHGDDENYCTIGKSALDYHTVDEFERDVYEEWVCANQTMTNSCLIPLNENGECWDKCTPMDNSEIIDATAVDMLSACYKGCQFSTQPIYNVTIPAPERYWDCVKLCENFYEDSNGRPSITKNCSVSYTMENEAINEWCTKNTVNEYWTCPDRNPHDCDIEILPPMVINYYYGKNCNLNFSAYQKDVNDTASDMISYIIKSNEAENIKNITELQPFSNFEVINDSYFVMSINFPFELDRGAS